MSTNTKVDDLNGFAGGGKQFLTFFIDNEEYGLEILRVQEIKGFSRITPIPNTPPEIKGVMNPRHRPIVDLRTLFRLAETEYSRFSVIIVVTIGTKAMGLVVDAVSDVLNVNPSELVAPPDLGTGVDTTFMTGMARTGERLVTLLNIDRLVGHPRLWKWPRLLDATGNMP